MKTLTLMSTVMLPLTFIAGVYGMNFKPEVSSGTCPSSSGCSAIRSRSG